MDLILSSSKTEPYHRYTKSKSILYLAKLNSPLLINSYRRSNVSQFSLSNEPRRHLHAHTPVSYLGLSPE